MNTQDMATIGVRLIGLASIAFGIILLASTILMQTLMGSETMQFTSSEFALHDSYYVLTSAVPGAVGVVVGVLLIAMSRSFSQLLTRGMKKEAVQPGAAANSHP